MTDLLQVADQVLPPMRKGFYAHAELSQPIEAVAVPARQAGSGGKATAPRFAPSGRCRAGRRVAIFCGGRVPVAEWELMGPTLRSGVHRAVAVRSGKCS